MSSELGNVTNKSVRDAIGTISMNAAVLAVDGVNVENVQTGAAVVHKINGVFQTDLAIIAEYDLSAATILSGKDGAVLAAPVTMPALNAGDDPQTKVYILACAGDNPYVIEPQTTNASQDYNNHELSCPDGYAPFGAIKIVHTPTDALGVAAFTLGVDDLTGITGRVASFYDIATCPPTVADLITL